MGKFDAVLFDFDGTIVDSLPAVGRSILRTLAHFGVDGGTMDDMRAYIGPPLRESFGRYPQIADRYDEVFAYYRAEHAQSLELYRVYDGVAEVLDALNKAGVTLGVATAKLEDSAKEILRRNDLLDRFDVVAGVVEGTRNGKNEVIEHAIQLCGGANVAMVGDRKFDVAGGKAFGLYTVGCLWGFGSLDELRDSGANVTAEKPLDLLNILI